MISIIIPSLPGYDQLNQDAVQSYKDTAPKFHREIETIIVVGDRTFAKNVNKGIQRAKGDVLLVSNNDVTALPGWFDWIRGTQEDEIRALTPKPDCGWGFAIPRKLVQQIGYLDENLQNSYEDYDYFIRAALNGFRRTLAPKIFALHEGGHTLNQVWGTFEEASKRRMQICHRNRDYMLNKWPDVQIDAVPMAHWAMNQVDIMSRWRKKRETA